MKKDLAVLLVRVLITIMLVSDGLGLLMNLPIVGMNLMLVGICITCVAGILITIIWTAK
jgi:hypothetical protein